MTRETAIGGPPGRAMASARIAGSFYFGFDLTYRKFPFYNHVVSQPHPSRRRGDRCRESCDEKECSMTFWAKVLIIVTLVLSIAFAAASGVIFAKRTNYRGMYHKAVEDAAKKEQEQNLRIADLEGKWEYQRSRAEDAERTLDSRNNDLVKKQQELDDLQTELANMTEDKDTQVALNRELAESNRSLAAAEADLRADYKRVSAESEKYLGELQAERKKTAELETAVTNLTNERDDLKVALADARKSIRETDEMLAEAASRNLEWKVLLDGWRIIPSIKSQVAEVDMENGVIVLNAGTEQGVKKNYEFTVFRDDKFVATVNVFQTWEGFCAASILTRAADIQLGDSAWTRLPGP